MERKLNVLVVGRGGREHALAWRIGQSPEVGTVYVAPGNAGTGKIAQNVPLQEVDIDHLLQFAQERVDLTVVGGESALAAGIVDHFRRKGLRIFGPIREAALLETSKIYAKERMAKCGIPTAPFKIFREYGAASAYVREVGCPIVIKADGLAGGKGVVCCRTMNDAMRALYDHLLVKKRGDGVVIESYLDGMEVSVHALCSGVQTIMFPPAQDHKRISGGHSSPMTGGMAAFTPVPWFSVLDIYFVRERIVVPALLHQWAAGFPFSGILYPGLMVSSPNRTIQTLEFNVRFGDPEAQAYMRHLKSDLLEMLTACVDGDLGHIKLEWHAGRTAVCLVLAAAGYPGIPRMGDRIKNLEQFDNGKKPGVHIFHAGTVRYGNAYYTAGGRVLGITAVGRSLQKALDRAYEAAEIIQFEGKQYRRDIGASALSS